MDIFQKENINRTTTMIPSTPSTPEQTMPDSPDYDALLDELVASVKDMATTEFLWDYDQAQTWQLEEAQKDVSAARSSLKDYVARIEAENERLKGIIRNADEEFASQNEHNFQLMLPKTIARATAELRASLPTQEEAAVLLIYLDNKATGKPIPQDATLAALGRSVDSKLRKLSGLSEGNN